MKKLVLGFSSAAIGLALLVVPSFAAGPTCTVPGDYSTIQAAVNDTGCTTINVSAGTYAENVNINHGLILNGPNVGTSGNGSRVGEAIVSSVNITASDVTIDGFSFTNAGIQMNINGSTKLSGVKVQNNVFSGYGSVGFPTYNAGNLLITRNLFKSPLANTESIQIKASSSTLGGCNGTVVSDNVFTAASNNGGADVNFSCTGSNSTDVTVSGNTDTGLADNNGTSFTAFSGVTDGIVVSNNNFTGTPTSGSPVFFFGGVSGTASITGNTIINGGSSAIAILGGTYTSDGPNTGTFTITNNDLSGNARGIYVSSDAFNSGAKVIANRNNLSGDTKYGIQNANSANIIADGTCNWWGAASGPGPVGSGTGSNVSTNVNYAPWLVSSDLNSSCVGNTVTVTIVKYFNGVPATSASTGGASYPMVSSWNATNLGEGSGAYTLSPTGFYNPNPYQATTSDMTYGATYATNEVTGGTSNVLPIGAQCQLGKTRLVGYSTGDSLDQAASTTPGSSSPSFTNITSNQYVVVWNESCIAPTTMNDCKNGGWVKFNTPTFKNQGACVSFVQANPHAGK